MLKVWGFFSSVHATSEINMKKKRKRTTGRETEEGSETKKKQRKQYRPNYFISLPITNPKVIPFIILICCAPTAIRGSRKKSV